MRGKRPRPPANRPPSSSSLGLEIELLGSVSSTFYTQCQPQNPTPQFNHQPLQTRSPLDEPPHVFERRPQSSESAAGKSSTPSRSSLASSTAAAAFAAFAAAARITKRSRDLLRSFRCLPPRGKVVCSFVHFQSLCAPQSRRDNDELKPLSLRLRECAEICVVVLE